MPDKAHQSVKQRIDSATLRVTVASTFVAVLAAIAALWSGYEAHETRIADERPFLAVDTTYVGTSPYYDNFQSKIVAFGKSPARRISVICDFVADDEAEHALWKPPKNDWSPTYPYLLPGRSIDIYCGVIHGNPNDGDLMTELGVVSYYDENNTHYQTPFCFLLTPMKNAPILIQTCTKSRGLPELK